MNASSAFTEQEAEDSTPDTVTPATTTQFAIPSHPALTDNISAEDGSTALRNIRKKDKQVSAFEFSLGLWCTNAGVSRPFYSTLLELMDELRDDAASKLDNLPKRLDTIKLWVKEQLPLLELRKIRIPLSKEQLPSSIGGLAVPGIPTEDLVFFNPIQLFRRILSSQTWLKLHCGLAVFKDTPRELWHADGWASSIRATCGEYARITGTNEPIFPSDWIRWRTTEGQRFGRVCAVGTYEMSAIRAGIVKESIVLKVQEGREGADIPAELLNILDPPLADREVLLCSEIIWIPEHAVSERVIPSVTIDYKFQDPNCTSATPSTPPQTGEATPSQTGEATPSHTEAFVRRMTDSWNVPTPANEGLPWPTITPFFRIAPIRAELELRHYSRSHFVEKFAGKRFPF